MEIRFQAFTVIKIEITEEFAVSFFTVRAEATWWRGGNSSKTLITIYEIARCHNKIKSISITNLGIVVKCCVVFLY
jgi:hypothetical protein